MGDWWNDFTNAVGSAANWVGGGIAGAWNSTGQWISDTQARAYGYNDAASYNEAMKTDPTYQADVAEANKNPVSNFLSKNPVAADAFNVLGGMGVGAGSPVNDQARYGDVAYPGNLPDLNQGGESRTADAAAGFNPTPSYMPQNAPSTLGSASYNPLTPVTNKVGYTPVLGTQSPPTSVGLSPVDVGQPGSDSNLASIQADKHPPGSNDESHYWNPTTNDWQTTPYTAPAAGTSHAPAATNPTTSGTNDSRLTSALQIAATGAGILTNLKNGQDQSKAEKDAADLLASSQDKVLNQQQKQFDQARTDTQPWRDAGAVALGKLSTFDADHPMGSFQASPDYAFRLSEGMKALENSASAHGGLLSGNTGQALVDYGQQAGSQEYANWYNRDKNERDTQRAGYQSLAGLGQQAVGQGIGAGQNFANAASNALTGQAQARAGGIQGAANATASSYQTAAQTGIAGINSAIALGQANDQYNALLKALQSRSNTNA